MSSKVKAVNYPLQTLSKLLHDSLMEYVESIKPIAAKVVEVDDSVAIIIDKPNNRSME